MKYKQKHQILVLGEKYDFDIENCLPQEHKAL